MPSWLRFTVGLGVLGIGVLGAAILLDAFFWITVGRMLGMPSLFDLGRNILWGAK